MCQCWSALNTRTGGACDLLSTSWSSIEPLCLLLEGELISNNIMYMTFDILIISICHFIHRLLRSPLTWYMPYGILIVLISSNMICITYVFWYFDYNCKARLAPCLPFLVKTALNGSIVQRSAGVLSSLTPKVLPCSSQWQFLSMFSRRSNVTWLLADRNKNSINM